MSNIRRIACVLGAVLMLNVSAPSAARAASVTEGEDRASGGGDVLKPGRKAPAKPGEGIRILLGFDAGLTHSTFKDGYLSYYLPNPYISRGFAETNGRPFVHYLNGSVNEGSGWGFAVGGALDLLFTRNIGMTVKLGYHTRHGIFEQDVNSGVFAENTVVTLHDRTDWTFDFINFDLLLRLALPLRDDYTGAGFNALYLLAGPSFGFLLSNKAKLEENIAAPNGIYYNEEIAGQISTANQILAASTSGEITGFQGTRVDFKIGLGAEIALTDRLALTPEVTVALPISKFVKAEYAGKDASHVTGPYPDADGNFHDPFIPGDPHYSDGTPSLGTRYLGTSVTGDHLFSFNNPDFNVTTVFLTLGLRWRIN